MNSDDRVCVGVIGAPHGVKGTLKIKSFTEDAARIFDFTELFYENGEAIELTPIGQSGNALLATIEGIADRDEASLLKGKKLFALRDEFPEANDGEFYIHDMVGLKVKLADGRVVGVVNNVANYGAGDVIEIAFNNGTDELYSFSETTFPQVDIAGGTITLNAPDMLEAKRL